MSVEIKLASGKGTMEQRIADRLKSSGDQRADFTTKKGDGPTRTFTQGFHAGHRPILELRRGNVGRKSSATIQAQPPKT